MFKIISDKVTHQGIGGKRFRIDERVTESLTPEEVSRKGIEEGNIACWNFMNRRDDFNLSFPHKLYYVKIDCLGYIIAEDEIVNVLEPHEDLNNIDIDPNNFKDPTGGNNGGTGAGAMAAATPELKVVKIEPVTDFQQELIKNIGKMSVEDITKSINSGMIRGGGY